jgi:predicted RNA-binding protein
MCEASVYIEKHGVEELVMEGVEVLEEEGDGVRMESIFGEEVRLRARVKRFALVNHRILLEELN